MYMYISVLLFEVVCVVLVALAPPFLCRVWAMPLQYTVSLQCALLLWTTCSLS